MSTLSPAQITVLAKYASYEIKRIRQRERRAGKGDAVVVNKNTMMMYLANGLNSALTGNPIPFGEARAVRRYPDKPVDMLNGNIAFVALGELLPVQRCYHSNIKDGINDPRIETIVASPMLESPVDNIDPIQLADPRLDFTKFTFDRANEVPLVMPNNATQQLKRKQPETENDQSKESSSPVSGATSSSVDDGPDIIILGMESIGDDEDEDEEENANAGFLNELSRNVHHAKGTGSRKRSKKGVPKSGNAPKINRMRTPETSTSAQEDENSLESEEVYVNHTKYVNDSFVDAVNRIGRSSRDSSSSAPNVVQSTRSYGHYALENYQSDIEGIASSDLQQDKDSEKMVNSLRAENIEASISLILQESGAFFIPEPNTHKFMDDIFLAANIFSRV